jgi:hypothetical protein
MSADEVGLQSAYHEISKQIEIPHIHDIHGTQIAISDHSLAVLAPRCNIQTAPVMTTAAASATPSTDNAPTIEASHSTSRVSRHHLPSMTHLHMHNLPAAQIAAGVASPRYGVAVLMGQQGLTNV